MKLGRTAFITVMIAGQLALAVVIIVLTQPFGNPGQVKKTEPASTPQRSTTTAAAPTPTPVASTVPPTPAAPTPAPATASATRSSISLPQRQSHPLTIVSWGGVYQAAQSETLIQPFAQASGLSVEEVAYDGSLTAASVLENLQKGESWDVVDVGQADVITGCRQGILRPIDWTRFEHKDDMLPAAIEECGVGNVVWSFVMAYNTQAVSRPPVSWSDFWNTSAIQGKRGLRDKAQYNLEFALMADGVAPRDVYAILATVQGVDRAFAKLQQIKQDVVWWSTAQEPIDLLENQSVVMSSTYSGRAAEAKSRNLPISLVWHNPIYALDYWVLAANSPNVDAAYAFLNFASRPEGLAAVADLVPYGSANTKSSQFVNPAILPDLPTNPENIRHGLLDGAEFWSANSGALEARFSAWLNN